MDMQYCARCEEYVVASSEGACPGCGNLIRPDAGEEQVVAASLANPARAPAGATPAQAPLSKPIKVLIPGALLLVVGILGTLNSAVLMMLPEPPPLPEYDDPVLQRSAENGRDFARMARTPLVALLYVFVGFGGVAMLKRQYWALAVVASVSAMAPCTVLVCLSLPVGLWSLIVLHLRDVKAAFQNSK